MTVNWNSRKGFNGGPNTLSSANEGADGPEKEAAVLASLQLALRKVPDARPAEVARGRKLLADPKYPSRDVLRRVAGLLARHWRRI